MITFSVIPAPVKKPRAHGNTQGNKTSSDAAALPVSRTELKAFDCMMNGLLRTEDPVARIPEARADVSVLVQLTVDVADVDLNVRMGFMQPLDAFRRGDDAEEFDVHAAVLLDEINGGNGHEVRLYGGNDNITVNGGNSQHIYGGAGRDTYKVNGGSGHVITLDEGTNNVTVSATDVTLKQTSKNEADTITIQWSERIGVLSISTYSNASSIYTDYLTVKGAKSTEFNFEKKSSYLTLSSTVDLGCGIEIKDWYRLGAFSNGITFDDTTLTFEQINQKAKFI